MVYHFTSREKNILHYLSISDTYILGKQLGGCHRGERADDPR